MRLRCCCIAAPTLLTLSRQNMLVGRGLVIESQMLRALAEAITCEISTLLITDIGDLVQVR